MKLDSTVIYSNDIEESVKFYRDIIGLELDYQQGDKFASFKFSNGVRLGIKKAVEEREKPGAQTFFIGVDNANEVYEKMKGKKLSFYKELTIEFWGTEFAILDPDGNKVEFLQRKDN